MTAAELYSVMKDVQREAWPPVGYSTYGEIFENGYGFVHEDIAELLFVGSMAKWLGIHAGTPKWERRSETLWLVAGCDRHGEDFEFKRPTLVEAFAAACKVVGEGR